MSMEGSASRDEADRLSMSGEPDHEEFARLFARHARQIYAFIMTLVFSHHDAEEVFQNTNVVLWDKFGEFRPGSNFFAWASRIAYFEVLNLMKQRRVPLLSSAAIDALVSEATGLSDQSTARVEALSECLSQLTPADREMIQDRYFYQRPPKQIAAMRSRSLDSVYRALNRIHNLLLNCVERTLSREEGR
jgi:RNA polymerase sigma-70 factor, ECF subfamily